MYSALYNPYLPNSGNGLGGFSCHDCSRVTRTETGMKLHCWRVHGKKAQRDFSFMPSGELVRSNPIDNGACSDPIDNGATSGGGADRPSGGLDPTASSVNSDVPELRTPGLPAKQA